jgi:hypothetical protein
MAPEDMERKKLAVSLLEKEVVFNHLPEGPRLRITSMSWDGMVTVDGFSGEFAPSCFTAAP